MTRPPDETQTTIAVEAVSPEFGCSSSVSTVITWETSGVQYGWPSGEFTLNELSENPVAGTAVISFCLPGAGPASLTVHDLSGRIVKILSSGNMPEGSQSVQWDTDNFPSGLYMYRLECAEGSIARKCMVLR